jgi:hypothetical protein
VLLAGAAQIRGGQQKKTPGDYGNVAGRECASNLGGTSTLAGLRGTSPRIRPLPDGLGPERAVDKTVDSLWMKPVLRLDPKMRTELAVDCLASHPNPPARQPPRRSPPTSRWWAPPIFSNGNGPAVTPEPPHRPIRAIQSRLLPLKICSPLIDIHWRQTSLMRSVPGGRSHNKLRSTFRCVALAGRSARKRTASRHVTTSARRNDQPARLVSRCMPGALALDAGERTTSLHQMKRFRPVGFVASRRSPRDDASSEPGGPTSCLRDIALAKVVDG